MVMMPKGCLIALFLVGIGETVCAIKDKSGVGAPPFNYIAPAKWADIGPGYKLCATGSHQSPVNIDTKKAVINNKLKPFKVAYDITSATLITTGLAAQLSVKGKTEVNIGGHTYRLLNLRWHTPSEHTIDGKKFVAELHRIFISTTEIGHLDIAIIATVYLVGPPDPIVNSIKAELEKLGGKMGGSDPAQPLSEEVPMDKFSGALLSKIPTTNYIAYPGSLTTPPCSEKVTWFLTDPQSMTLEQAKLLNAVQSNSNKANARPTQPLNGRIVQLNPKVK